MEDNTEDNLDFEFSNITPITRQDIYPILHIIKNTQIKYSCIDIFEDIKAIIRLYKNIILSFNCQKFININIKYEINKLYTEAKNILYEYQPVDTTYLDNHMYLKNIIYKLNYNINLILIQCLIHYKKI
jgi:hypothetical protein